MVAPFFRDRPRVEKGPRWYILLGMGLTCFFPLGFALWVLWYWWSGRSLSKEEAKARKKAYNSALRRIFSVPAMLIVLGGFAMFDRASMVRAYDGWDISSQDRLVVQPAKVTGLLAMETRREAQHQLSPVQRDVYHYGAAQAAWLALDRPGVTRHLGAMTGTWRPDPTNARRIGFMAAQVEGTLSAPSRVMLAKVGVDQAAERLCQMIRHATLAFGLTLLMLSAYSFHLSRHTGRYVQTTRLRLFQIRALQEAAA